MRRLSHLIGKTPIMRLLATEKYFGISAQLYAKLEMVNPGGSVKDRAALFMMERAKRLGLIGRGSIVVEATSGNMGISLAMLSSVYGYRAVIVMPENMSAERVSLIRAYGGEVIFTPESGGMAEAKRRAAEIAEERGGYMPGQFTNPENSHAHYSTTGREIYRDMHGRVDVFLCGVGTGGTLGGGGRYLKEKNSSIRLIAVEPEESAVLSGKNPGPHGIQGIGAGFAPPLLMDIHPDGVITENTDRAIWGVRELSRREGVFCGISSGAVYSAAISLGAMAENRGKRIVMVLPDGGERYLSVLSKYLTT